jgi:hypothetical protein
VRLLFALWLMLLSCLAEAQQVDPIRNGVVVTSSGSQAASQLFYGNICMDYTVGAVTGGGSVVFTVGTVDPQNPSAGFIAIVAGPSISSASGPFATCISAATSSSVVVSWTVTGTFSATVWLSVQGLIGGGGSSSGGGGGAQDAGVYLLPGSTVFVDGGNVVVTNLPSILPDGGAVTAYQGGTWTVGTTTIGDGGTQPVVGMGGTIGTTTIGDGGVEAVAIMNTPLPVAVNGDGGTLPVVGVGGSMAVTQGTASSLLATVTQQGNNWGVNFNGDGGVGAVAIMNPPTSYPSTIIGDGGTLPVVVVGVAPVALPVYFPGDGGNVSTYITGGTVTATISLPSIVPDGGAVQAGQLGNWAALLIYDGGILPVDNSAQDGGSTCDTLCGTNGTLISCVAGQRSATICNNGSNSICIGTTPALSCPSAIDAGTTIGSVLVSGQCIDWGGGINAYCVAVPGQQQTAPDAGTVTIGGH